MFYCDTLHHFTPNDNMVRNPNSIAPVLFLHTAHLPVAFASGDDVDRLYLIKYSCLDFVEPYLD